MTLETTRENSIHKHASYHFRQYDTPTEYLARANIITILIKYLITSPWQQKSLCSEGLWLPLTNINPKWEHSQVQLRRDLAASTSVFKHKHLAGYSLGTCCPITQPETVQEWVTREGNLYIAVGANQQMAQTLHALGNNSNWKDEPPRVICISLNSD